ncbi:MAG: glycoside hydrolase family 15 protein [Chloroflexi bacterium]|nr:glycoside hydrolase family 15 protein [Chloroflexota bacterium]
MPRDIPIGNGSLLINFDASYRLRDIYYPHVGQENHSAGHPFRFGVWTDGQFRWVDDSRWERKLDYAGDTLMTKVTLRHPDLALRLVCNDVVDFHENLYLRRITIHNEADREREVRLFFHHDFHILGNAVGDTAYYEPERRAILHYKRNRWFLISGARQNEPHGLDQWATGNKEVANQEGTWRDAEDGHLEGNPIAQGSVDSAVALHATVPAAGQAVITYWMAVGCDFKEVTRIHRAVRHRKPETFTRRTEAYWNLWVNKEGRSLGDLPHDVRHLFRRSLAILRTQIDNGGAVIAANDFDIAHLGRDTYSYMWPRDGALVTSALIEAGYSEASRQFFDFCHRIISPEGFFLHKYNPDGTLASSWHPWLLNGKKCLPVQEDETGLVIWALWRHYQKFRDVEFIKPLYRGLIIRAAQWMVSYRSEADHLPLESYDLWEERRGVLSFTVAAVWAGLIAAANFADAFGEEDSASRYRTAAGEIRAAADQHLYDESAGRFVRMVNRRDDGTFDVDMTLDASLFGLWYFGMYAPDDPRIVRTMKAIRERLWVRTDVGGVARYENDYYHQVSQDVANVPGNPWFICTLWLAQWEIAKAQSRDDLEPARKILEWVAARARPSGVLAEQVNPYTDAPLSVSPLTWSHATFVATVLEYLAHS